MAGGENALLFIFVFQIVWAQIWLSWCLGSIERQHPCIHRQHTVLCLGWCTEVDVSESRDSPSQMLWLEDDLPPPPLHRLMCMNTWSPDSGTIWGGHGTFRTGGLA